MIPIHGLLGRLPALATVGVGSLPFIDPAAAVRHATRAYDVPFCPQLPAIDGDMIGEWLGADPARCGWTPERDRPEPRAWQAFLAAIAARPPAHGVAKLQVTGPLTLAAGLVRSTGAGPGDGRGTRALAAELATWLAGNAAAQVRALGALGVQTVLVVDEPGLAALGADPALARVWDPLRAAAPAWGLHVCGPVPWALVRAAEPDLLSYDLVRYGADAEARAGLAALVGRGGRVAFGAIDPSDPDRAPRLAARVAPELGALATALAVAPAVLARSVMLSPACGTGRLSGQREHLVAAELGAGALLLRDLVVSSPSSEAHGLTVDRPSPHLNGP